MTIVSFDGDEEKSYCDKCGYILIPMGKGSDTMACTGCERMFGAQETKLHKKSLNPVDAEIEPVFVSMSNYNSDRPKTETAGEREDRLMCSKKSGMYMISAEETHYDI